MRHIRLKLISMIRKWFPGISWYLRHRGNKCPYGPGIPLNRMEQKKAQCTMLSYIFVRRSHVFIFYWSGPGFVYPILYWQNYNENLWDIVRKLGHRLCRWPGVNEVRDRDKYGHPLFYMGRKYNTHTWCNWSLSTDKWLHNTILLVCNDLAMP